MNSTNETETLRHLLDFGRRVLSALDPEVVFGLVLAEARAITGAR